MLRQTHFTFTLAKLRLLQVGLRDLPYRLLTQAASVEPRSSKSAGRTRANRTGSTSSRGGAPRGPAGFRFFRPRGAPRRRASTLTPRRQGPPIRSRWATRHVLNLPGPPTRQCQKRVLTRIAKVSTMARTKRRVLEDRDRRTAEQRAAAAARKTASIHAASRIPSTQELHSRPAKVPRAARAEETESSATDSDEEVNTQASICAYCTHVLPSEL